MSNDWGVFAGSPEPSRELTKSRLQEILDPKVQEVLVINDCQSSSIDTKDCCEEESMCYTAAVNSDFGSATSRAADNSCSSVVVLDRATDQINPAELLDLVSSPTEMLSSPSREKLATSESPTCRVNANIKSIINYQNNQIKNQIASWDSLLSGNNSLREINQNVNDSQDQNNRFSGKDKCCEDMQTSITSIFDEERGDKVIIGDNECDESKESRENYNNSISNREYRSKCISSPDSSAVQTSRIQEDLDVVVPSESAAVEPQEMAHVPQVSEGNALNSSNSAGVVPSNNESLEGGSMVHKDTAAILQELALQRLSGGDRVETIPVRRRYDSELARDRRSFDSEIGREIVREHKMKLELENARGKLDESLAGGHNTT